MSSKSAALEECPLCRGTGKREMPSFANPSKKITKTCSACRGKGKIKMNKASMTIRRRAISYKGQIYITAGSAETEKLRKLCISALTEAKAALRKVPTSNFEDFPIFTEYGNTPINSRNRITEIIADINDTIKGLSAKRQASVKVTSKSASSKCTVEFQDTNRGIDAVLLSSDGRSLNVIHTGKKTLSKSEKSKLTTKLMAGCAELSKDYKKNPK